MLRDLVQACTVRIVAGERHGSGFFVTGDRVLTCAHVLGDESRAELWLPGSASPVDAEVKARIELADSPFSAIDEPWPDLAVVEVLDGRDHDCVLLSDRMPDDGQRVTVTGYPQLGGATDTLVPVSCRVPGLGYGPDGQTYLVLQEGSIRPGHSGGPVYGPTNDPAGVIGVIAATAGGEHLVIPWRAVKDHPELAALAHGNADAHPADSPWRGRPAVLAVRHYLDRVIEYLDRDPWAYRFYKGPMQVPSAIERNLYVETGSEPEQVVTPDDTGSLDAQRVAAAIEAAGEELEQVVSADDAADSCRRLVILGEPGAGKTWLAKRTARRCAERARDALAGGAMLSEVEIPST